MLDVLFCFSFSLVFFSSWKPRYKYSAILDKKFALCSIFCHQLLDLDLHWPTMLDRVHILTYEDPQTGFGPKSLSWIPVLTLENKSLGTLQVCFENLLTFLFLLFVFRPGLLMSLWPPSTSAAAPSADTAGGNRNQSQESIYGICAPPCQLCLKSRWGQWADCLSTLRGRSRSASGLSSRWKISGDLSLWTGLSRYVTFNIFLITVIIGDDP